MWYYTYSTPALRKFAQDRGLVNSEEKCKRSRLAQRLCKADRDWTFRLLDLPAELRLAVYDFALCKTLSRKSRLQKPCTALLRTCRQIHDEAEEHLYLNVPLEIKICPPSLPDFLHHGFSISSISKWSSGKGPSPCQNAKNTLPICLRKARSLVLIIDMGHLASYSWAMLSAINILLMELFLRANRLRCIVLEVPGYRPELWHLKRQLARLPQSLSLLPRVPSVRSLTHSTIPISLQEHIFQKRVPLIKSRLRPKELLEGICDATNALQQAAHCTIDMSCSNAVITLSASLRQATRLLPMCGLPYETPETRPILSMWRLAISTLYPETRGVRSRPPDIKGLLFYNTEDIWTPRSRGVFAAFHRFNPDELIQELCIKSKPPNRPMALKEAFRVDEGGEYASSGPTGATVLLQVQSNASMIQHLCLKRGYGSLAQLLRYGGDELCNPVALLTELDDFDLDKMRHEIARVKVLLDVTRTLGILTWEDALKRGLDITDL